ncbi:hypothetical protein BC835DRAFT_1308826 [Cytidiella melzeri]|nr:hypothetical protein BC835DRAFT_1308826 [Cytidiella melzeri]
MPLRQVKDYVITEVSRGARRKIRALPIASSARSKRKTSQKKTTRSPENIKHAALQDDCIMDEQLEGNASGKKAKCLLRTHQRLHTHLLQQYSDKTFRKVTLAEMGHIRYLGHHGEHCIEAVSEEVGAWADEEESNLMEVDEQGDRGFVAEETHAQILVVDSSGIAEHTFSDYMLESTACKTSGNAFWSKLQRRTDNAFTSDVPVGLGSIPRVFKSIAMLAVSSNTEMVWTCPQPGINMPAGWKTDSRSYDFQMTISLNSGPHYAAGGCIGGQLLQMDSFQPTTLKQLQSLPVLMFRSPMEKDI